MRRNFRKRIVLGPMLKLSEAYRNNKPIFTSTAVGKCCGVFHMWVKIKITIVTSCFGTRKNNTSGKRFPIFSVKLKFLYINQINDRRRRHTYNVKTYFCFSWQILNSENALESTVVLGWGIIWYELTEHNWVLVFS